MVTRRVARLVRGVKGKDRIMTGNSLDFYALKPSSQEKLTRAAASSLPEGMVVLRRFPHDSYDPCVIIAGSGLPKPHPYYRFPYFQDGNLLWSSLRPLWLQGLFPEIRLPKLPRMSFALTTDAIRERRKDVTRRLELPRWWQTGRWFLGVDKVRQAGAQGLCIAQCVSARMEKIDVIDQAECDREGFSHTTPEGFIAMFGEQTPPYWDRLVWRLEFRYLEVPA